MGGVSQVGLSDSHSVHRVEESRPVPTVILVLTLLWLSKLGLGCAGWGWWDCAIMAAATQGLCSMVLVQWCASPSTRKEMTGFCSCLKLSYFTGLHLKDLILLGPPGAGVETRTSGTQKGQ